MVGSDCSTGTSLRNPLFQRAEPFEAKLPPAGKGVATSGIAEGLGEPGGRLDRKIRAPETRKEGVAPAGKVKSERKWIGLYLLANVGGAIVGWGVGAASYGHLFAAGIFVLMIIYAVMTRERKVRA